MLSFDSLSSIFKGGAFQQPWRAAAWPPPGCSTTAATGWPTELGQAEAARTAVHLPLAAPNLVSFLRALSALLPVVCRSLLSRVESYECPLPVLLRVQDFAGALALLHASLLCNRRKVHSHRTHVLTRPGMYIGATDEVEAEQWVFDPAALEQARASAWCAPQMRGQQQVLTSQRHVQVPGPQYHRAVIAQLKDGQLLSVPGHVQYAALSRSARQTSVK